MISNNKRKQMCVLRNMALPKERLNNGLRMGFRLVHVSCPRTRDGYFCVGVPVACSAPTTLLNLRSPYLFTKRVALYGEMDRLQRIILETDMQE